jgi:hypothetical protein
MKEVDPGSEDNGENKGAGAGDKDPVADEEESDNSDTDATAEGKKPGHPNRFKGAERVLMDSFQERYEKIIASSKGKRKGLTIFWEDIHDAYWSAFTPEDARASIGRAAVDWDEGQVVRSTNKVSKHVGFIQVENCLPCCSRLVGTSVTSI